LWHARRARIAACSLAGDRRDAGVGEAARIITPDHDRQARRRPSLPAGNGSPHAMDTAAEQQASLSVERTYATGRDAMLYTIAVILLVLWLLGFFVVHVGGGLIHLLLVIAVIVVIVQLITGRRAL
jgi:hypothetical protein